MRMFRRFLVVCAAACATIVVAAPPASARPHMMVGLLDQASTFYNADVAFPIYKKLRVQVVRVDLYWGGTDLAVAKRRPVHATDPADPAYNWDVYDRVVSFAAKYRMKLLFTIWRTARRSGQCASGRRGTSRISSSSSTRSTSACTASTSCRARSTTQRFAPPSIPVSTPRC